MEESKIAKKKKRKSKPFTVPVALVAGVTAPFVVPTNYHPKSILSYALEGDFENAGKVFMEKFTGIDQTGVFQLAVLASTYKPVIAGLGVHYIASKLGINRRIAAAGIPVLRI